jgi:hypothetical protein
MVSDGPTDDERKRAVRDLETIDHAARSAVALLPRRHDRWTRELVLEVAKAAARFALSQDRRTPP